MKGCFEPEEPLTCHFSVIKGVGFFDFIHEQRGVAPNGIELHPILGIEFLQNLTRPIIVNAFIEGKKLFVAGFNFAPKALVFVNDQKQKTTNDTENPSFNLIAKKAGKKISKGQTVALKVQNPDGIESPNYIFRRPE